MSNIQQIGKQYQSNKQQSNAQYKKADPWFIFAVFTYKDCNLKDTFSQPRHFIVSDEQTAINYCKYWGNKHGALYMDIEQSCTVSQSKQWLSKLGVIDEKA
jgi:hypothetical protein